MYRYIKSNRNDEYFGQIMYDKHHEEVQDLYHGKTISTRVDIADQPGGIEYEADQLGMDLYDLIECLEGMSYNGEAIEIQDGVYRIK